MTRIDFYIPSDDGPAVHERIACRLAEKAWERGHRIYVHVPEPDAAARFSQQLWTFRDGSFVPHQVVEPGAAPDGVSPILVGWGDDPFGLDDVLINLTDDVPLFFSRFHRMAEVVHPAEPRRRQARDRFRFYRERGYRLDSHDVPGN